MSEVMLLLMIDDDRRDASKPFKHVTRDDPLRNGIYLPLGSDSYSEHVK